VKLLLLSGSLRGGSTNNAVLETIAEMVGDTVAVRYTGTAQLPHFNPDDDHDPLPAPVVELRSAIAASDVLLICTPEYAGSLPGSFKNLLDWTVGGVETEHKRAAWINVSTSPAGAADTHTALRAVLTYTGCDVVDEACRHVPTPRSAVADGVVTDASLRSAYAEVVQSLRRQVDRQAGASLP